MKAGVSTVRLIECIAATPWAGASRPRAGMTNVEKA